MLALSLFIGDLGTQAVLGRASADTGVREQNRQQDQIGEDQYGNADRRGDGQLTNDLDVDHQQHCETNGIC
ncbi:hypothetical protein D9M69_684360 [compost metagenome]